MMRLLALMIIGIMICLPAAAEAPVRVPVRVGDHPGFDRLAFDWPRMVPFEIKRDGAQVTVVFAAAAQFVPQANARDKLKRVGGMIADRGAGGSRFAFIVAPGAQIKNFRSGNKVVIDVVGSAVGSVAKPAQLSAATPAPQAAASPPVQKPSPAVQPAAGTPPATPDKSAVPPVVAAKSEPVKPAVAAANAPASAPPTAQPSEPMTSAPAAAPVAAPVAAPQPVRTLSGSERAQLLQNNPAPMAGSTLTVPQAGQPPALVLQLNPGIPLAFAAYQRGGYAYLMLERKLTLDAKQLIAVQNPQLQLQPLNLPEATGWRFAMPQGADLRVDRSGTSWLVYVAGEKRQVPVTLGLTAEPDYALGPRLFLPAINPPNVIRLFDPVIGDELSVTPLLQPGDAVTSMRSYADLTVLPTAQGLVIAHRNDTLVVRKVPNGIEITADGGLRLSAMQDTGVMPRMDTTRPANKALLFDFATWRGLPNENFTQTRQRLLQNVVDVSPTERDRARIELARFYFAHGFAAESLALLNYIRERLPDMFARPEFRALHGAAQILTGNTAAGLQDFASDELADVADRPLWEALALAQQRDYAGAAAKFNATIGFIDDFPDPIFVRFALMALESLVATGQEAKADQWLENWRLSKQHMEFLESPAVEYLEGVIHYALRNPEQAAKHWRIAAAGKDRLYRTRAELALVDFDLGKGKMTPASAAQRLEGLRFAWRGDALEWEILRRLGLYYFQAKKFRDGFVNLERARKFYPNEAGNAVLAKTMSDTFHDLYTTELGANLTPLEALSLYQDYRYLVTDQAVAQPIMRALTERLVAIDLLEQAQQLLQDLMRTATGLERTKLGTRLAGIALLDRQPAKTIAALDASQADGLSEDMQQERLLLRARALNELGQNDAAKALLTGRNDPVGQMLLADMAWKAGQWGDAAAALRRIVDGFPQDKPLQPEQAQQLVRLATALALADDRPALAQLAKEFSRLMHPTNQKEIFTVLTTAQDAGSLRDIAAKVGKSGDNDLFRKFLERYRGAPPPETKPAVVKP